MPTQFLWTGALGASNTDWNGASGTLTNWRDLTDNTTTIVPGAPGDEARFTDGGADAVSGTARVDQITIENNTFVTINSGHIDAGDLIASNNAGLPDDLVVNSESRLIIASGAGMENDGSVSVVGLSSTGSLEVDSGGDFGAEGLIIGDSVDGTGVVTAIGASGFFVVGGNSGSGELIVGNAGNGTLTVESTAAFFSQSAVVGMDQGAVGGLTVGSSTWSGGALTIGAAGMGNVTVGSGASVALSDVVVGSAQTGSGDLTVNSADFNADSLTVGQDGTGTATFGAGSTGYFAAVIVGENLGAMANLTMDGAIWNSGSLTIGQTGTGHATAAAGEVITINNGVLGSGQDASGDLTLDDASLNGGSLTIGLDGTGDVTMDAGSTGTMTSVVLGADQDASGTLTMDGAAWNVGTLTVGLTGTGQATVENGATATVGTVLIGPTGNLAVTAAASAGTVIASQVTLDFGVLDVSQGGQVLIGATVGVNGAVAVGGNSSLTGLGSLNGDVVLSNGGLVQATAPVPGALMIDGNISGAGTIQPLMTLEVNGVIDAGVTIAFSPSIAAQVGELVLDVPGGEQGTITGFSTGNTIDLKGVAYTNAVFTQGTSGSAGTLTLSGGASSPLSLSVVGDYAADAFTAAPVTLSGALVQIASPTSGAFTANSFAGTSETDTVVTVVSCFATGTRIATALGPVAVEDLRVGDRVVTADGRIEPIRWIGSRTIDCARHPRPDAVWPVRVAAGAFAENVPHRDLFLSPDHAVLVDGSLVPVKLLVNGAGVVQIQRPKITYYHIELSCHELVLAEGLAVESYLDVGDRMSFAGDAMRLFPDVVSRRTSNAAFEWETRGAAPLRLLGNAVAGNSTFARVF